MKAYPQCIPCLINQGLNAVRKLNLGKELEKRIATEALKFLAGFETFERSPAYYAYFIQQIVKDISGKEDPFYEMKKLANSKALKMLKKLTKPKDLTPLEWALKLSCVGNYIDFAIKGVFDIERDINTLLSKGFLVWDIDVFKDKLKDAFGVLIIGDNAGEIAFDKPLVEHLKSLGKEVVYAVKGEPILNDVLLEDASEVSMSKLCRVIDNGSDKVGTWLEDCSAEFREEFYRADIVISKGQANFETLNDADRDIFFLLVAKCDPIATETGAKVGNLILKYKS